ncbi:uncharacterized protein LOC133887844 [Phragmites australis]|uniref:uncharacterized protein LOC133887844 n=1 Tax=Phragmites australis TaxID=29695 RepID=UPI002D7888CA|nr:uncharacterized protein LOC133887844 [Phragmites australis]
MKHQADKHRTERVFAVGDLVYLKLQPYIQSSVAHRPHHKFSFRYYGPYPVLERVGAVAYKLKLPEGALIHLVVHVSQLKKAIGPNTPGAVTIPWIIVQWQGLALNMATWEDKKMLRRRFPDLPAWGQAVFEGGGNVTPAGSTRARELKESQENDMATGAQTSV